MNPIDLIKKGIETSDWSCILDAYSKLTGQNLDLPEQEDILSKTIQYLQYLQSEKKETSPKIDINLTKAPRKYKKKVKAILDESDEKIDKNVEEAINNIDETQALANGAVSIKGRKPVVPFNHLVDENEMAAAQELAKTVASKVVKIKRPTHKDVFCNCSECGQEFNFTKAYPAGLVQSGKDNSGKSALIRCESCLNKRIK